MRNWARAGHLLVIATRPISFNLEEVLALKERIRTNRFNKLRKRANKSASDTIANPEIRDAKIASDLANCIKELDDRAVAAHHAVFAAALHYLAKFDEVSFRGTPKYFEDLTWRRPAVAKIMRGWYDRSGTNIYDAKPEAVEAFLGWKDCDDPLGLLYQGLSSVGTKSRTGAYFTPGDIIDATLADLGDSVASFLDPCCGTGRFLVRAARRFNLPFDQLYGACQK
ncbi:MAG: N-6 DNA methylase [Planctomycetaceae bacterium]|nr:N-6 DNA methylase [Planctomycetaceae bacterium]